LTDVKDVSPAPRDDEALGDVLAPRDAFRIALPNFEGPLDLLLHLIREHKLEVLDIPIALITEKYLAHLDAMREIDLDIAGEFLVMASTLLHLKSRMLLPREEVAAGPDGVESAAESLDPRAELVRRLLEYQKYKDAAESLAMNDLLDRDVFARRVVVQEVPLEAEEVGLQEVSIYKLIEALDRVLENLVPKKQHEVTREHLSLSEAMNGIVTRLRANEGEEVRFLSMFEGQRTRSAVVITFLGLLELAKMKLVRVFQLDDRDDIFISAKPSLASYIMPAPEDVDREYQ
jgi:segregation and condensation protein A